MAGVAFSQLNGLFSHQGMLSAGIESTLSRLEGGTRWMRWHSVHLDLLRVRDWKIRPISLLLFLRLGGHMRQMAIPPIPLSLPLHMQSASRDRVRSSRKVCPSPWAQLCPASPRDLLENPLFFLGCENKCRTFFVFGSRTARQVQYEKSPFYPSMDAVVFPLDRDDGGG